MKFNQAAVRSYGNIFSTVLCINFRCICRNKSMPYHTIAVLNHNILLKILKKSHFIFSCQFEWNEFLIHESKYIPYW